MVRTLTVQPILSPILRDRRFGLFVCIAATLQFILTFFRFPGWPCPFFHALGIPCPGCGLTRATLFLIEGQWKQSLLMHAFAPLVVVGLLLMAFCTVAPRQHAERLATGTEAIERRTGLTILIIGGLILYWLARLLFMHTAFIRMIQG